MPPRDPAVAMHQMRSHAREAIALVEGRRRAWLDRNRVAELALTHLVEILGEAANRVPSDVQQRHPEIPWAEAIGMRHKLAHGYDVVDRDVLWAVANDSLPALVRALDRILEAPGRRRRRA